MSIKINIQSQRAVPQVNDNGLTLVVLKYAEPKSGVQSRGVPFKIDAFDLTTLVASFDAPETIDLAVGTEDGLVYAATGKTITGSGTPDYSSLEAGDKIEISGTVSNDGVFTVASAVAGVITVEEALVDETLAGTTTITKAEALKKARELYALEYLLSTGVSVLCYATETSGEIDADDIANITDIELLRYRLVVAPYSFVTLADDESELTGLIAGTTHDAQLFLDLASDILHTAVVAPSNPSPKIEFFINSGYVSVTSKFTSNLDISVGSTNFVGITSALAAVARKAKLINTDRPYLPVAGETYGKLPEFIALYRELTTVEKVGFQAKEVNVVVSKVGVGQLFVSQNTQYGSEGHLKRSHVVTQALVIKRKLYEIADAIKFLPNNLGTWNVVSLRIKDMLRRYQNAEGILSFSVAVGTNITMTAEEAAAGLMRVAVSFVPTSLVESIEFNVTIQETDSIYDVQISGGAL